MFDWELCKLGGLATISSGGTPNRENPSYWNGDIPWATTTEVNYQIIKNTNEKITFEGLSNSSAKLMPKGTILMAMYGQGKTRGQVGILGIESTTNQANANIIVNNHTNNFFVYQQLVKKYEEIRKSANEGGQANLSLSIVKDITISWTPSLDEQKKIGLFFKRIDETIALHQRKIELLKQLKKAYLQHMFPVNREKVPRVRFGDFEENWEEHRIEDCFVERAERSDKGELISVTINSGVLRAVDLDRSDNSSKDKTNYKIVKQGDIAYNSMRMWQGASGYSPYEGILSPAYTVITPKNEISSKFFAYMFKRNDMIQNFQKNSQGLTSDTWNLKFPALRRIRVCVPTFDEQEKIAIFFNQLNDLINIHQNNLKQLKNLKKSYLQKMFI